MPKELIYSGEALGARRYVGDGNDAPPPYPVEHVAIGWEKDRGVQLGVASGPAAEIRIATDSSGAVVDSLWMDLDRDGCNRLIRSLRKARDAAYGADA